MWVVSILVACGLAAVTVVLVLGMERARWLFQAPRERGRLLWKVGHYDEAIKSFRAALEADPNDVVSLRGMARCYRRKGGLKDAAMWADRAVEHDATPLAHVLRAEIAADAGAVWRDAPGGRTELTEADREHLAAAATHAQAALKLDATHGPAHRVLAQVAARLGDLEAALAHIRRGLKVDPQSRQARLLAAHLLMQDNKLHEALGHVQYILDTLDPRHRPALLLGTEINLLLGQWDEALALCERLMAVGERGGGVHVQLAACRLGKGEFERAVAEADKAEALFGGKVGDPRLYWARGTALLKLRRYDRAIVDFTVLAEQGGKDAVAFCRLGQAYAGTGQGELARDAFVKAARIEPRFFPAREELARLLAGEGRTAEALEQLRKGIEALGHDAQAYESLVRFCVEHGLHDEAEIELRRLLGIYPRSTKLAVLLCRLYLERGDIEHALALARYAVGLKPDSAELIHLLGQVEAADGSYDTAAARFARAVRVDPSHTAAYLDWARMEHARGNTAAADDVYGRARKALGGPIEVRIAQARFWMATGRAERAIKELRGVLEKSPRQLAALVPLVEHLLAQGRKDEALAEASRAVRSLPDSASAQSLLARVHRARGEWAEFLMGIGRVVSDLDPHAWVGYQRVAAYVHEQRYAGAVDVARDALERFPARRRMVQLDMAIAQFLAGKQAEAIEAMSRAASEDGFDCDAGIILSLMRFLTTHKATVVPACRQDALPQIALGAWADLVRLAGKQPDEARRLARALLEAFIYEHAGWHEMAVAKCTEAHAASPTSTMAAALIPVIWERAGHRAKAVAACTRMVGRHPHFAGARELLGDLMLLEGKPDEADALYAGLAQEDLPAADLLAKRALLAAARGNHMQAIEAWRTVLRIHPRHLQACNNLAWLLATSPEPDLHEAVRLAEQARTLAPGDPAVLDTAGWAHYHAGHYAKAIGLLQAAVRAAPYRAAYHFHLGMAHARKGEAAMARQALRKAIALDRDGDFVDAARQTVADLGS